MMEKRLLAVSVICSLVVIRAGYASNDVIVDLSVLDAIGQGNVNTITHEPLFPQVSTKSQSVKKQVSKPQAKLPMPEKEKPLPPVTAEEENIEPQKEKVSEETVDSNLDSVLSSHKNPFAVADQVSEAEEKNEELLVSVEEKVSQAEEKSVEEQSDSLVSTEEKNMELSSEFQQNESSDEDVYSDIPQTEAEQLSSGESVLSAQINDFQSADSRKLQPKEIYFVSFEEDSSNLSEEEKQRILSIIENFKQSKKIAIKAYYYDSGENSFSKKRICLNRATEVRSFLLGKGFKNFSIKIISTTADNENKNTVEIEEMK